MCETFDKKKNPPDNERTILSDFFTAQRCGGRNNFSFGFLFPIEFDGSVIITQLFVGSKFGWWVLMKKPAKIIQKKKYIIPWRLRMMDFQTYYF